MTKAKHCAAVAMNKCYANPDNCFFEQSQGLYLLWFLKLAALSNRIT